MIAAHGLELHDDDGKVILILTGPSGDHIASIRLESETAGGLGGQLLSAAHRPLQARYSISASLPSELDPETPEDEPQSRQDAITPSILAERVRPAPQRPAIPYSSHLPDVDDELHGPWRFTHTALENLAKHGITREEIIAIAENPTVITPADYGGGSNYVRGGHRRTHSSGRPALDHRGLPRGDRREDRAPTRRRRSPQTKQSRRAHETPRGARIHRLNRQRPPEGTASGTRRQLRPSGHTERSSQL